MLRIAISLGNSSPVTVAEANTFLISAISWKETNHIWDKTTSKQNLSLSLPVEQVCGVGLQLRVDKSQCSLPHNLLASVNLHYEKCNWKLDRNLPRYFKFIYSVHLAKYANDGSFGVSSDQGHQRVLNHGDFPSVFALIKFRLKF